MVECGQPDWATWTSHHLVEVQDEHVTGKSSNWQALKPGDVIPTGVEKPLGWATYFSTLPTHPGGLPSGVESHQLGAGWLLTIGENPADVPADLLLAVRDVLGEQVLG